MIYLLIFILLLFLEILYFRIADKYNIIDKPNERSSHIRITLRGGGIIFYLGILLYMSFYGFEYLYFFIGLTLICFISFIDDIRSVSSKVRLLAHLGAMLLMFYQWGIWNNSPWWYIVVALIFCTGLINAYNFMDGINGITGGYSCIVALTLLYINNEIVCFIEPSYLYVVVLSLFVFNLFNFRRNAKCFAGDVGSVGIAFILLFALGLLILKTENLYWIVLLAVYGVDSILTIVHRLILHENIFGPHRKHVYQILANELHISHIKVSFLYMLLQSVINIFFLLIGNQNQGIYFLVIIVLLSCIYIYMIRNYFNMKEKSFQTNDYE